MDVRLLLVAVAWGVVGCASPPAVDCVDRAPEGGVAVPLTFHSDMPTVELRVGDRPLRMILDLGGTDALAVTESALRELEPRWTGGTRFVSDAFGRVRRSREFVLPHVGLAGLDLHDVRGYEVHDERVQIPRTRGRAPVQCDGYIGIDLLRRYNLLLDYPNDRVVLVDHAAAPPVDTAGWAVSPFEDHPHGVMSEIELDGHRRRACWDTGANHTIIRPDRAPEALERWSRGPYPAVRARTLTVAGASLGPFDLMLMEFTQPKVDVILGTNLFREHAVWIDFPRRRLAIEPNPASSDDSRSPGL